MRNSLEQYAKHILYPGLLCGAGGTARAAAYALKHLPLSIVQVLFDRLKASMLRKLCVQADGCKESSYF